MDEPSGIASQAPSDMDLACARCGYNLRGLDANGRCPECGEAIAVSTSGRSLAIADNRWTRRLALGAILTGICPAGLIVTMFLLSQVLSDSRTATHIVFAVVFAIGVVGVWLISSKEPGGPYYNEAKWTRRTLRALGVAALPGIAFGLLELWWRTDLKILGMSVSVAQSIAALVSFPAAMLALMVVQPRYQALLARRLPSRRLARHGHLSMLAILMVLAIDAGVIVVFENGSGISATWSIVLNAVAFVVLSWPGVYSVVWGVKVGWLARTRSSLPSAQHRRSPGKA